MYCLKVFFCPASSGSIQAYIFMSFLTHNGSEVNEFSFSVSFGLLATPYGRGIQFSTLSQKRSIDANAFQFISNQLFP